MITDKLLESLASHTNGDDTSEREIEDRAEQILDEVNEEFREVIEAIKKVESPHLLAILTRGGMGAWENCTDDNVNSLDDLIQITELVVGIASEYIEDAYGREALASFLAHLVANNL